MPVATQMSLPIVWLLSVCWNKGEGDLKQWVPKSSRLRKKARQNKGFAAPFLRGISPKLSPLRNTPAFLHPYFRMANYNTAQEGVYTAYWRYTPTFLTELCQKCPWCSLEGVERSSLRKGGETAENRKPNRHPPIPIRGSMDPLAELINMDVGGVWLTKDHCIYHLKLGRVESMETKGGRHDMLWPEATNYDTFRHSYS